MALSGETVPLFVKGRPRPPGSGRKKGQPNWATVRRRAAEAAGLKEQMELIKNTEMPLDFLLRKIATHYHRRPTNARLLAPRRRSVTRSCRQWRTSIWTAEVSRLPQWSP